MERVFGIKGDTGFMQEKFLVHCTTSLVGNGNYLKSKSGFNRLKLESLNCLTYLKSAQNSILIYICTNLSPAKPVLSLHVHISNSFVNDALTITLFTLAHFP